MLLERELFSLNIKRHTWKKKKKDTLGISEVRFSSYRKGRLHAMHTYQAPTVFQGVCPYYF